MKIRYRLVKFVAVFILSTIVIQTEAASPNVKAWGHNEYGQCNVPNDLTNAVAIAGGDSFALALRSDGTLIAWGDNTDGRTNIPPDLTNIVAIAAEQGHSLAIRSDGRVVAWGGANVYGESTVPPSLVNHTDFVSVAAGMWHSLGLLTNGIVVAWGSDIYGNTDIPEGLSNVVSISTSFAHNLALSTDGTVVAWGWNEYGISTVPIGLTNVVAVSAGYMQSLALLANGTVVTWGYEVPGQMDVPVGLTNVVAISAGAIHNMALCADGTVVVWGVDHCCDIIPTFPLPVGKISAGEYFNLALMNYIPPLPTVSISPKMQTMVVGSTAYVSATPNCVPKFTYQWYFGNDPIGGATNDVLELPDIHIWQSGEYHVVVTNPGGSTTSDTATINVVTSLDINMVPAISVAGEIGTNYALQFINAIGPTNNWTNLATFVITNNPQVYCDVSAIGQPKRFYRLVQTP